MKRAARESWDLPNGAVIQASLMLAQGTHPKVVSERLGHATVGITLDIYSHVLPGLQREAAERLDELLAVK